MLLQFEIENYKSFRKKTVFSMTAKPRQTGLDYSIMKENVGRKELRGLSSAVIYGPNASGKTTLIGALDTMRAIVLRGNIENAEDHFDPNQAAHILELIPNNASAASPVRFAIRFTEKGFLIDYNFAIQVGAFLESDALREVLDENLSVNDRPVFSRKHGLLEISSGSIPKEFAQTGMSSVSNDTMRSIVEDNLGVTDLFLCNGFKNVYSSRLYALVWNWFKEKLNVVYRSDAVQLSRRIPDPEKDKIYLSESLTEAARAFGVTTNELGHRVEGDKTVLYSVFKEHRVAVPADIFESYGTIRFVTEFPMIIRALRTGGTLVVDEFDASIHPMALMNIITIFHNDDINRNHAQLIFDTHNPIFLNSSLFRRDEIKFVERDEETGFSTHYALSDFKTSNGIRKGEDYMSNYFVNRYGAIKDIDFTAIVEAWLDGTKQESENE